MCVCVCSNSSFRKLGDQILRALRKRPMRTLLFVITLWFKISFTVFLMVDFEFKHFIIIYQGDPKCQIMYQPLFFKNNNICNKQKLGRPMGSPISGVSACLFQEFLESKTFKLISPNDTLDTSHRKKNNYLPFWTPD